MKIRGTFRNFVAAGAVAFALAAGAGAWLKAQAQVTALFPFSTITSVGASVVQIAPTNPTRRSFTICNGSTNSVFILPALNPAGAAVSPTATAGIFLGTNTCFTPPANLLASGSAVGGGQAWNAIGTVAGPTSVSFTEW